MAQTNLVTSGTTSVSLNLPLLELALGATLVSADTIGEPFSEEFQLGFPIVADTDFRFETEPFTPLDGTINHSGTVTLNLNGAPITVGDFSIGFDASRISNIASGFFVSDTTEDRLDLEILFDISAPGNITTEEGLTISDADLLVTSELANALGSANFIGADVGDIRIDASAINIDEDVADPNADLITVSIAATARTLIESEGTETTIILSLSEPPPAEGLVVDIGSGVPFSLGDFDILPPEPQAVFSGGELVRGFDDSSGLSFRITEQVATITLPIFDDADLPAEDPNATRNDDIGVETVTYSLLADGDFAISPNASNVTFTLADTQEQLNEQTIPLFRFRNTGFTSGTYVFVGTEERDGILADPNLSNSFSLDGVAEDGTINPAFVASTVPGENLIPFFRLASVDLPGTFLFVSTGEYNAIFAENSDQRDRWTRQGLDGNGEDIPEFYLLDGAADRGVEFNRFQNSQNGTFLYAGPAETNAINANPNLSNLFVNQGVAFESLG
ncbi:MAG: hypothetical protein AAGA80_19435 [Cyanobacteria bacterium P01_F01_bin.143]